MLWNESKAIDIEETKQVDIIVKDLSVYYAMTEERLIVYSDTESFLFTSGYMYEDYSVNKLYKSLSKGDRISLTYYEANHFFKKTNVVVDAKTKTSIYRTFDEYNNGKDGLRTFVIIIFFCNRIDIRWHSIFTLLDQQKCSKRN